MFTLHHRDIDIEVLQALQHPVAHEVFADTANC
jgi:hypothetical protein